MIELITHFRNVVFCDDSCDLILIPAYAYRGAAG